MVLILIGTDLACLISCSRSVLLQRLMLILKPEELSLSKERQTSIYRYISLPLSVNVYCFCVILCNCISSIDRVGQSQRWTPSKPNVFVLNNRGVRGSKKKSIRCRQPNWNSGVYGFYSTGPGYPHANPRYVLEGIFDTFSFRVFKKFSLLSLNSKLDLFSLNRDSLLRCWIYIPLHFSKCIAMLPILLLCIFPK